MENLTTAVPHPPNLSDSNLNTTEYANTTTEPEGGGIPGYPPGYFILSAEDMSKYRIAMYGVVIPATILVGFVGNIISFVVLLRHKMPRTTKMVLIVITVCDFLNLIACLLFCLTGLSGVLKFTPGSNAGARAYPIFGSYLLLLFGRISSTMIVLISLERFCAVFFPLKIKTLCSSKVMGGCIAVCILCLAFLFIPNTLEFQPVDIPIPNSSMVKTILLPTEIGKNRDMYRTLYTSNMMITRNLPIVIVMVCNIAISINLYRSRSARSEMTGKTSAESSTERRVTKTLLALSVVYLVCMMPNSIIVIIQVLDPGRPYPYNRNNLYNLFTIFFFWFEVINSSANFIIYIISSKQMREEFKRVVACGPSGIGKPMSGTSNIGSASTSLATVSGVRDGP